MKKIVLILLMAMSCSMAVAQWKGVTGPAQKNTSSGLFRWNFGSDGVFNPFTSFYTRTQVDSLLAVISAGGCPECAFINTNNVFIGTNDFNSTVNFNNDVNLNNSAIISPVSLSGTFTPFLFWNSTNNKISSTGGLAYYDGSKILWNMSSQFNSGATFNSGTFNFNNSFNFNNPDDFSALSDNQILVRSGSAGGRVGVVSKNIFASKSQLDSAILANTYTASNGITKDILNFKLGGPINEFTLFDISQGAWSFNSDGTQYGFKNSSTINSQAAYFSSIDTITNGRAVMSVNSALASIGAQRGPYLSYLYIDSLKMLIDDRYHNVGLQAANNYHASYATHPRAYVDAAFIDSTSNAKAPQQNIIFQQSVFTTGDLTSKLTAVGFTPTITSTGAINFTGGSPSGTQYIKLNNATNADPNMDFEVLFKVNSLGGGIRIGKLSVNTHAPLSVSGKMDLSTNTWAIAAGVTGNALSSRATSIAVAAGDECLIKAKLRNGYITYQFTDITQNNISTEVDNLGIIVNTGDYFITNDGGNIDIKSIKLTSLTPVGASIICTGDSKTWINGNYAYPNLLKPLGGAYNFGGYGDATAEWLQQLPYIIQYKKPKVVTVNIGSNDVRLSLPFTANYTAGINLLTSAGIKVVHILPIPEVMDQSALNSFIAANYTDTVNISTGWTNAKYLGADSTHQNTDGSRFVANKVINSNLISASNISDSQVDKLRDLTNLALLDQESDFVIPGSTIKVNRSTTVPLLMTEGTDAATSLTGTSVIQASKNTAANIRLITAGTQNPAINFVASGGTTTTPTAVANSRIVGAINWIAHDGISSTAPTVGYFRGIVDGTPAANSVPLRYELGTFGATKWTWFSDGRYQIGGTNTASSTTYRTTYLVNTVTPTLNNTTAYGIVGGTSLATGTGVLTATASGTTSASDGTVTAQPAVTLTGSGSGAAFTVTTVSNAATVITQTTGGTGYAINDTFTIAALPGITFTVTALGYTGGAIVDFQFNHFAQFVNIASPTNIPVGAMYQTNPDLFWKNTSGTTFNITHPAAANITGTLAAAQFPALTGDVTTTAGSLATAIKSSVSLAGSPTTTTQAAGTNNTTIATMAALFNERSNTFSFSNKTFADKIRVATGANSSIGQATLVAGTVTVNTTAVSASSLIFLTVPTAGGTRGTLTYTISAGTSFTITSSSATDTSTINYVIIN